MTLAPCVITSLPTIGGIDGQACCALIACHGGTCAGSDAGGGGLIGGCMTLAPCVIASAQTIGSNAGSNTDGVAGGAGSAASDGALASATGSNIVSSPRTASAA